MLTKELGSTNVVPSEADQIPLIKFFYFNKCWRRIGAKPTCILLKTYTEFWLISVLAKYIGLL